MTSICTVIQWLDEHEYQLSRRRRDAVDPKRYMYFFVREGRRIIGLRVVDGQVNDKHWVQVTKEALSDGDET